MSNYTPTGAPANQTRGVSATIRSEFQAVATAIATKSDTAGETYSGTHDFTGATPKVPTKTQGDNSTNAASTAYVDASTAAEAATRAAADTALQSSKADLASPALTGTPTAPTAVVGTSTNQLATCAFVAATSFNAELPSQGGNAGKFVTTDGVNASWAAIVPPQVIRSTRTSNTILAAGDNQKLIDITSGTFTQTFTAAATLGSGWYCYIRNSGTGDITLDPNASETIDGLTSYIMYPGEVRLVQCDGVGFNSVVLNAFYRTFTSSGTFTKPPGYGNFSGLLWGAGASGTGNNTSAGGGGGGACAPFVLAASDLGTTETVTIGSGGAASASSGNAGGNSTLGSLVAAYGGGAPGIYPAGGGGLLSAGGSNYGGKPTNQNYVSGNTDNQTFCGAFGGGSPTHVSVGNAISPQPVYGGGSGASAPGNAQDGKNSVWGGAGGGSVSSSSAIAAGTSKYGGNGGAASTSTVGTAGSTPGGGGGASMTSTSGAGASGELRIWGVI